MMNESLEKIVALLEAGDWQAAHPLAQEQSSALAAWAHGIVHTLEGDLWNAKYWYGRAKREFPGAEKVREEITALKKACAASPGKAD